MLPLLPLIVFSAYSLAIFSTLFVAFMTDYMDESWSPAKENQQSLSAMVFLGLGEIVGALVFGRIQDSCRTSVTVFANMLAMVIAICTVQLFTYVGDFTLWFASVMTFLWGLQDGGLNCFINCILGFQFDEKTAPFSVLKFVQSLFTFAFVCIEGQLKSSRDFYSFYGVCLITGVVSWLVFLIYFEMRE
jgi:predicted MFS family arabinose efflux permease